MSSHVFSCLLSSVEKHDAQRSAYPHFSRVLTNFQVLQRPCLHETREVNAFQNSKMKGSTTEMFIYVR